MEAEKKEAGGDRDPQGSGSPGGGEGGDLMQVDEAPHVAAKHEEEEGEEGERGANKNDAEGGHAPPGMTKVGKKAARERDETNGGSATEDSDVPPAKVAKLSSNAKDGSEVKAETDKDDDKHNAGANEEDEEGKKKGSEEEGTETTTQKSSGGEEGETGKDKDENNASTAAAPTRRSLRPRKPVVKGRENNSDNGSGGGPSSAHKEKKDKDGGDAKDGSKGEGGKSSSGRDEKGKKGGSGGGGGGAKGEEKILLQYNGMPLDAATLRSAKVDSLIQVRIPKEYLSSNNRQVRSRQLWGTDVYTEDSDVVTALVHVGYVNLTTIDSISSEIDSLKVTLKMAKAQNSYASKNSNNIRSRSWNAFHSDSDEKLCSYSIKGCVAVLVSGEEVKMYPAPEAFAIIPPTFVPAATERVVNTRSSASSTDRKNRFKQEVTLQYNLCNEPWLKYVMASVADRGLQPSKWTSARMQSEVIYAESQTTRYELTLNESPSTTAKKEGGGGSEEEEGEEEGGMEGQTVNGNHPSISSEGRSNGSSSSSSLYRWSKCEQICTLSEMRKIGIPFPPPQVKVLQDNVEWEHFKWGPNGVHIQDTFYPLSRIHFMQKQQPSA